MSIEQEIDRLLHFEDHEFLDETEFGDIEPPKFEITYDEDVIDDIEGPPVFDGDIIEDTFDTDEPPAFPDEVPSDELYEETEPSVPEPSDELIDESIQESSDALTDEPVHDESSPDIQSDAEAQEKLDQLGANRAEELTKETQPEADHSADFFSMLTQDITEINISSEGSDE